MGLFATIKAFNAFRQGRKLVDDDGVWDVPGIEAGNTLDNVYDNIRVLADAGAMIEPYLKAPNGKPKKGSSAIIDALYAPNTQMSAYQFRKMLFVESSVQDQFFILIHDKQDDFTKPTTADKVTGFEIVPFASPIDQEMTQWQFSVNNGSLMVDSSRLMRMTDMLNPNDLRYGYSAVTAVYKWASLDDFIISAQIKMFRNGAMPRGIFDITASIGDYGTIKDSIKKAIRNGSNGSALFNHIPINKSGTNGGNTISWHPLTSTNRDMTVGALFDNNSRKMNGYFGVPEETKGYLQNSNYSSVIMADYMLIERAVRPRATAIYSKLTAELNRCLGGFGGSLAFDLETPQVAQNELYQAQQVASETDTIIKLRSAGYSLANIIAGTGFNANYLNLGEPVVATPDANPEAQTSNGNDTPEAEAKTLKITSKADSGGDKPYFLDQPAVDLSKAVGLGEQRLIASQQKMVATAISRIFGAKTKDASDNLPDIPTGEFFYDENKNDSSQQAVSNAIIIAVAVAMIISGDHNNAVAKQWLAENGITESFANFTAGDQKFATLARAFANKASNKNEQALINQFDVSRSPMIQRLRDLLPDVAKSYSDETAKSIRAVLDNAIVNGISQKDLLTQLKRVGLEDWRAKRMSDDMTKRADNEAYMHVMNRVWQAMPAGTEAYKTAKAGDEAPCGFCQTYIGQYVPLGSNFVSKGDMMEDALTGALRHNTFADISAANFHPNCHCENMVVLVAPGMTFTTE